MGIKSASLLSEIGLVFLALKGHSKFLKGTQNSKYPISIYLITWNFRDTLISRISRFKKNREI